MSEDGREIRPRPPLVFLEALAAELLAELLLAAVALRNSVGQLARNFVDVVMAKLTLLLLKISEVLLLARAIGALALPALLTQTKAETLMTESAELVALLLLQRLQHLRNHRQYLANNFADVLRRQGSLIESAAIRGHWLVLLILLLRLSDDLRQHRSDLLQNGAYVLLR